MKGTLWCVVVPILFTMRRRALYAILFLMLVGTRASEDEHDDDDDEKEYFFRRVFDPDKHQPQKGDPTCKSLYERIQAITQGDLQGLVEQCRGEESSDDPADENFESSPSSGDEPPDSFPGFSPPVNRPPPPANRPPPQQGGGGNVSNSVRFNVFVGVPPNVGSLGHLLGVVTTLYLNVTSPDYGYRLREWDEQALFASSTSPLLEAALSLADQVLWTDAKKKVANLYLIHADPELMQQEEDVWWWKYRFRYKCFWTADDTPVYNSTVRKRIKRHTVRLLDAGIEALHSGMWQELLDESSMLMGLVDPEALKLSMRKPWVDPGDSAGALPEEEEPPPVVAAPSVPSSSAPPPPTAAPVNSVDRDVFNIGEGGDDDGIIVVSHLDTGHWDWRRYLGLVLLLGTVVCFVVLVQCASIRRRRLAKKDIWSNLGTQEGVEELLRTGWKIRGTKMEVYDKKDVGYRDDDSMLIGGFEQCEQVIGAEITVTQSETSPGGTVHQSTS